MLYKEVSIGADFVCVQQNNNLHVVHDWMRTKHLS